MKTLLTFLGLLGILMPAAHGQPNIVVIMADDLDVQQLSCYGGQNLKTPHLDRLAGEGLRFTNMIASEAMCIPTRASLFTGLYPVRHGAYQNHKAVNSSLKSIGHYLGDLGYTVALTGKDHMTKTQSVFPFRILEGFEPNCVAKTDDYDLTALRDFVETQTDPFCLFVMSINPHAPWTVGDPSEFDPEKLILPRHWVDTPETRETFCKYLAEVRRLDDQVGDVARLLKESGKEQNTVFVFLGEQGAQFPGAKWNLWDAGQRSAMIVRWPGTVSPGTVTDAIVQYEDITPTFVDIANGTPIAGLDGQSFRDVLTGKTTQARPFAYGIHNNISEGPPFPIRSIRSTRYKLIRNLTAENPYAIKFMNRKDVAYWDSWHKKAETSPEALEKTERIAHRPAVEFYDLQNDPDELRNLADERRYRKRIKQYEKALSAWMTAQGDPGAALDVPFTNR